MKYFLLASGSAGNSTAFVNDDNEIMLVDCGIPLNEIKEKLAKYDLDFNNIKAVLITHTHGDHVRSIRAFDPNIVYINEGCGMVEFNSFNYYETFSVLGYEITTLPMSHDSPSTTGFLIKYKNEKLAYITDTGYVHENVQKLINNCDTYLMESNHDPRLLMLTKRPAYIKARIISSNGHLSNQDSALVLANVLGPSTKEIVFIHRSREGNSEDMLMTTFKMVMEKQKIDISNIKLMIADQIIAKSYLDF